MSSILCLPRKGECVIRPQKEEIPWFSWILKLVHFSIKFATTIVVDVKDILENIGRFFLFAAIERTSAEGIPTSQRSTMDI